jgi:hypothetical protein
MSKSLSLHPNSESFRRMMLKAEEKATACISEAVAYNKEIWDKSHKQPDLQIVDLDLISTLNFHNLKGNRKLKDSFVGPFVVHCLHGNNAVEVILAGEFSQRHPTFPISLVKKFIGENPSTPQQVMQDHSTLPDNHQIKSRMPSKVLDEKIIRTQGKEVRQYLVRFKNSSTDDDQWLNKEDIKNFDTLVRRFRATKRQKAVTHIRAILFRGAIVSLQQVLASTALGANITHSQDKR